MKLNKIIGTFIIFLLLIGIFYSVGYFISGEHNCGEWVNESNGSSTNTPCSENYLDYLRIIFIGFVLFGGILWITIIIASLVYLSYIFYNFIESILSRCLNGKGDVKNE